MRSRVFVLVALIVCVGGLVADAAADRPALSKAGQIENPPTRAHGTLGGLTVTLVDGGGLQGIVSVGGTTAGGASFTSLEAVRVYGQIYDTPWIGGCTGTDVPGVDCNLFIDGSTHDYLSTTGGPYSDTWTFVVPTEDVYQAWGMVLAGWYPYPPFGTYPTNFWYSQITTGSGNITTVTQATATPDPNAGGVPVPTLGTYGIISLILVMAGVAILLITRRS